MRHLLCFLFFWFKLNISKFEICGLGPLKGVEMAACGMQSVDLTKDVKKTIKYLLFVQREPNEIKNLLSSFYQ